MPSLCKACGKREVSEIVPSVARDPDGAISELSHVAEVYTLCQACRKFYFRYKPKFSQLNDLREAACDGNLHGVDSLRKCTLCRFRRCQAIIKTKNRFFTSNDNDSHLRVTGGRDFSKIPCAVCASPSNGCHFGAVTCEGCKGFFRRSVNGIFKGEYKCKKAIEDGESTADSPCPPTSNCRKCRLDRCFAAGMSKALVSFGRYSVVRRARINSSFQVAPSSSNSMSPETPSSICSKVEESSSVAAPLDQPSSDWLIEECVKASAHLATISSVRIQFQVTYTLIEMTQLQMQGLDVYLKAVSSFVNTLPFINQELSVNDKRVLFASSFPAILVAQFGLDYDVANQRPNFFGLQPGITTEIARRTIPHKYSQVEQFLVDAGNALVRNISNIREFALFCSLLYLHHEDPQLENPETVSNLRTKYSMALMEYTHKNAKESEGKVAGIFSMLQQYRKVTQTLFSSFYELGQEQPIVKNQMTPLVAEIESHLLNKYIPSLFE